MIIEGVTEPVSETGVSVAEEGGLGMLGTGWGSGVGSAGVAATHHRKGEMSQRRDVWPESRSPACSLRKRSRISFCLRSLCANNLALMRVTSLADLVSDIVSELGVAADSRPRLDCPGASPVSFISPAADVDEVCGADDPGGFGKNEFEVAGRGIVATGGDGSTVIG